MNGIRELAASIDRDRVRAAREASPVEKMLAGPRLFDRVRSTMAAGVRQQFPRADEQQVRTIVRSRLALTRRLENQRDE